MSNMTLFEIDQELREVLDQVDPETGEIPMQYMELMNVAKEKKLPALFAYMRNEEMEADTMEAFAKGILAKVKSKRNKVDWLKDQGKNFMQIWGITEIKHNTGAFKAKIYKDRDYSVEIINELQIPQEYKKHVPESWTIDKMAIRKALKDGVVIEGAKLNFSDRLEVR